MPKRIRCPLDHKQTFDGPSRLMGRRLRLYRHSVFNTDLFHDYAPIRILPKMVERFSGCGCNGAARPFRSTGQFVALINWFSYKTMAVDEKFPCRDGSPQCEAVVEHEVHQFGADLKE